MKRIRRWIQSDMSKRDSKFSILINSKVGIFTCINLFIFHFVSSTTESLRSNHTNDYFWTKAHLRKLGSYKGLKVVQPMSQVSSSGGPMVTCRHTWPLWPGALWSRSAERRREQSQRGTRWCGGDGNTVSSGPRQVMSLSHDGYWACVLWILRNAQWSNAFTKRVQ